MDFIQILKKMGGDIKKTNLNFRQLLHLLKNQTKKALLINYYLVRIQSKKPDRFVSNLL